MCLDCTEWTVFNNSCSDLNELTLFHLIYPSVWIVMSAVKQFKHTLTLITNHSWLKTWNMWEIRKRIDFIQQQSEKDIHKEVRHETRKEKTKIKMYKDKVEDQNSTGDLWAAWKGFKPMSSVSQINNETDRKPVKTEGLEEAALSNASFWKMRLFWSYVLS